MTKCERGGVMGLPKDLLRDNPDLNEWAIIVAYRGSISHGMYVPSNDPNSIDDKDVMSVCIPPISHYFGLKEFGSRGTREVWKGEWDIVVYEVLKFVRLVAKGNPNVLSMLWLEPNYYLDLKPEGELLIKNRGLFVGRHVFHSFSGYAHSQLHKMTRLAFEGYMGEKRKQLVEKHGYDTKNAAHLIRLLRMAIEFLNEGQLHVMRPDAQQLLEIKGGEWTLEQVKDEASRLFKRAEEAYDRSTLPVEPDREKVNALCVDILRMHFKS